MNSRSLGMWKRKCYELDDLLFVGDVHADFSLLLKLLRKNNDKQVYQVGDLGIGFKHYNKYAERFEYTGCTFPDNFKFIRGNHDNPEKCAEYPNCLGNFGYIADLKLFFIAGAYSIDQHLRKEGIDFWNNEQLSLSELSNAIRLVIDKRPDIIISHCAPNEIADIVIGYPAAHCDTSNALTMIFSEYKPKVWIFGHYHKKFEMDILGTKFIGLPSLHD